MNILVACELKPTEIVKEYRPWVNSLLMEKKGIILVKKTGAKLLLEWG